ncbi:MAG: EF-P lysine aminoacylase EpmA [Steroidobacteraceae bacterium]|nr:EF-P lysine aminoacylase EpmA [Steroidobacteraceae bacterium]MDW8259786.1 EF-P lysine aminoacylase EpmA [Gammaproteobacteria bacterium]
MRDDWRPTADLAALRARAELLRRVRDFMHHRGVLEVETPALIAAPATDPQLHSAEVRLPGIDRPLFLHTSPEYAMKRLLAAGSGDIYQICKVFRGAEHSRVHNAEFTLLEWYRVGWSIERFLDEIAALLRHALAPRAVPEPAQLRYRDALLQYAQVDIERADRDTLAAVAAAAGLDAATARQADRDTLLDALLALRVAPALDSERPVFLTHFPASQAALARRDPDDARYALRFELYWQGVELANGYDELTDAAELATRFAADQSLRTSRGLPRYPLDERLLGALRSGLPPCCGVALGLDRLLLVARGAQSLTECIAFPLERA